MKRRIDQKNKQIMNSGNGNAAKPPKSLKFIINNDFGSLQGNANQVNDRLRDIPQYGSNSSETAFTHIYNNIYNNYLNNNMVSTNSRFSNEILKPSSIFPDKDRQDNQRDTRSIRRYHSLERSNSRNLSNNNDENTPNKFGKYGVIRHESRRSDRRFKPNNHELLPYIDNSGNGASGVITNYKVLNPGLMYGMYNLNEYENQQDFLGKASGVLGDLRLNMGMNDWQMNSKRKVEKLSELENKIRLVSMQNDPRSKPYVIIQIPKDYTLKSKREMDYVLNIDPPKSILKKVDQEKERKYSARKLASGLSIGGDLDKNHMNYSNNDEQFAYELAHLFLGVDGKGKFFSHKEQSGNFIVSDFLKQLISDLHKK